MVGKGVKALHRYILGRLIIYVRLLRIQLYQMLD